MRDLFPRRFKAAAHARIAIAVVTLFVSPAIGAKKSPLRVVPPPRAPVSSESNLALSGVSASVLVGYATRDLGFGVGGRAGYTFEKRLYVGGTVVYQAGTVQSTPLETDRPSLIYAGPEVGYTFAISRLSIRPTLGIGPTRRWLSRSFTAAACPEGATCPHLITAENRLGGWIGGSVLYALTPHIFVGADARALMVISVSVGLFATGGVRF